MATVSEQAIDLFVEAGVVTHEAGVLPDALNELSVRLDLIGAGPVLDEWIARRPSAQARRQRWERTWARRHRKAQQ